MSISKISIGGIIFGGLFALFSAIRYFLITIDYSFAILCIGLGLVIVVLSIFYDFFLSIREMIEKDKEENRIAIEACENWISDRDNEERGDIKAILDKYEEEIKKRLKEEEKNDK